MSLYDNARERRQWDKLSEFFAIIKTTEHLENARIKSAIGRDEVRMSIHMSISTSMSMTNSICHSIRLRRVKG